jgi:hypothetical protein
VHWNSKGETNYGFADGPSIDLLLCTVATEGHSEVATSLNMHTMNLNVPERQTDRLRGAAVIYRQHFSAKVKTAVLTDA